MSMMPDSFSDLMASPYYPWVKIGLAPVVALLVVAVVFRIGMGMAQRLTRHRPVAGTVVKAGEEPARLVVALIALQAVWNTAPDPLHGIHTVTQLTTLLLIGAITWLAVRAASG